MSFYYNTCWHTSREQEKFETIRFLWLNNSEICELYWENNLMREIILTFYKILRCLTHSNLRGKPSVGVVKLVWYGTYWCLFIIQIYSCFNHKCIIISSSSFICLKINSSFTKIELISKHTTAEWGGWVEIYLLLTIQTWMSNLIRIKLVFVKFPSKYAEQ